MYNIFIITPHHSNASSSKHSDSQTFTKQEISPKIDDMVEKMQKKETEKLQNIRQTLFPRLQAANTQISRLSQSRKYQQKQTTQQKRCNRNREVIEYQTNISSQVQLHQLIKQCNKNFYQAQGYTDRDMICFVCERMTK